MRRSGSVLAVTALATAMAVAACASTPRSASTDTRAGTATVAPGAGAGPLAPGATRTPPTSHAPPPVKPPPSRVRVTAAGDQGSGPDASAVLAGVARTRPDLHLALGDLSYGVTGEEAAWCRFVTDRVGTSLPFELVSGNHESDGLNGRIDAFASCLPNRLPGLVGRYGREWYVDVPQEHPVVRIVMISPGLTFADGTWSYASGTTHHAWTRAALRGARSEGIPWVVVGMHEPCLSLGRYACTVGTDLADLLVAEHADVVLTGHEHLYQRTKQLALGPGCPGLVPGRFVAACVVDADPYVVGGHGTVFVTVGTGGIALRDVSTTDPESGYFAASSGANRTPTHGFVDLVATRDILRATFVRASGGAFLDRVVLTRPAAP